MNTKPVTLHLRADFSIHFQYKPFCNRKAESCRIFASCFICFIETFKDSLKIDPIRIFHSILTLASLCFLLFSESSILYSMIQPVFTMFCIILLSACPFPMIQTGVSVKSIPEQFPFLPIHHNMKTLFLSESELSFVVLFSIHTFHFLTLYK